MAGTVLSVATRAVLTACERLGLEAEALLRAAALTREEVLDPDARIPFAKADALWRAAAARSSDPLLALHAAEALPFGAYKVIDYLGAHSATLGDALSRLASYFDLIDARGVLELTHTSAGTLLTMRSASGAPLPPPAQDFTLAAIVTRMRAIAGAFPLESVELAYEAPRDPSEHQRLFAAPLLFDAPNPRLRFSASVCATPIRAADPALLSILEAHATRLREELPKHHGLRERVHATLLEELRAQRAPTIASAAKRLALAERTLQRRLSEEGATFATVLDDARHALTRAYLRDAELGLAEIAWLVGFADQSTFTRAFKRWTGEAPGSWRALSGRREQAASGARRARRSRSSS